MPLDPRFYKPLGGRSLAEIAAQTDTELVGVPDRIVQSIAPANTAQNDELSFFEGDEAAVANISANAGACFVRPELAPALPEHLPKLISEFPRLSHARAAALLVEPRHWEAGAEAVDPEANIHSTVKLGPGTVVGAGAAIGEGSIVYPNVIIGPGVQIGRNCLIGPGASLICALVGDHVSIGAGARIGEPGFGTMAGPQGAESAPQFGRVVIQDHVRVGSNSCVDRGAFDDTIIGERTKIDNLCQIAHNVTTGRSVVIAAFGGISGTVNLGDGAMLGGRVGVADHVNVGTGASLAASAGVFRDIPDGETWGGTPAKPIRQWMRETAWLQKQVSGSKKSKNG